MKNWVNGYGPVPAILMIVGEAPAREEVKAGVPFVGKAGKILDRLLDIIDFPRELIYITNYSKRMLNSSKDISDEEHKLFQSILRQELRDVHPDIIVPLGYIATHYFIGDCKMTKVNGIPYVWRGKLLIPSIHPAAIIYHPDYEVPVTRSFNVIKSALNGEIGIDNAKRRKEGRLTLYTATLLVTHLFPGSVPVVIRQKTKEKFTNIEIKSEKEDDE